MSYSRPTIFPTILTAPPECDTSSARALAKKKARAKPDSALRPCPEHPQKNSRSSLLDHLVGGGEQGRRQLEAERPLRSERGQPSQVRIGSLESAHAESLAGSFVGRFRELACGQGPLTSLQAPHGRRQFSLRFRPLGSRPSPCLV